MLSLVELRRMVKKHNELMSIKIPPRTTRDQLIEIIKKNGYDIDHEKKKLIPRIKMKRKQTINLPPPPPKKTEAEKKEAKEKKKLRDAKRDKEGYDRELKKRVEAVKKVRSVAPKKPAEKPKPKPKPEVKKPEAKRKPTNVKKKEVSKVSSGGGSSSNTGKVKIWTGAGILPNGKTTNNDVLFETAWRKQGYKVANLKPSGKPKLKEKISLMDSIAGKELENIPLNISRPIRMPGTKNQYSQDTMRGRGKINAKTLPDALLEYDFKASKGSLDYLKNNMYPGFVVEVKIFASSGEKKPKFKTLQPPFKKGTIKIIKRDKQADRFLEDDLIYIKK